MKVSKIKRFVKDCFDVGITDPSKIYESIIEENPESSKDGKLIGRVINCSKLLNEKTDKKKKDEEKDLYGDEDETPTSFVDLGDNELYEQIVGNKYIDAKGKIYDTITYGETTYIPHKGEEIEENKEVVMLPTDIVDYESMNELIDEIKDFIKKYYDCDEKVLTYSAWYILLTWVYDRLNTINYLRALGDHGTGKSRWMDTIGRLCYKATIGSGAGSMAALKRMVRKWRGTVLTDEGDLKDDDERNSLIKFYNLGFEKNRMIYQCNKNDPDKIDFFDPYCPKIITTRKVFSDQALESRCLTHITKVSKKKDIPIILPNEFFEEQEELRNKLLKFRFDYYEKINVNDILKIELGEDLEPRIKQMAISFASLFANIPDVFDTFKKFLVDYQKDIIEMRSESFDGMIIKSIYDMMKDDNKFITSGKIAEYISTEKFKVNSRTVGKHIKGLGLITKNERFDGNRGRVIVINDDLFDIFKKYVPDYESERMERFAHEEQGQAPFLKNFIKSGSKNQIVKKNKKKCAVYDTHVLDVPVVPTTQTIEKMKQLQEHLNPVPFDDLLKSFNGEVTKEKLTKILDFLKKDGIIFELKPKFYQVI